MDIWWHLRTGQLIWQRGSVPQVDWFTYTNQDRPWIDLHWGFQLLMAGLHGVGGVRLLILTKALVTALAIAVAWLAGGRGLPVWAKILLWIPAVIVISGRSYVRPEMLSLLFLGTWLLVLDRMRDHPRWVWFLPLIQVLWLNCHALFVLGLVVCAAYAVDHLVRMKCGGRFGLEPLSHVPVTGRGSRRAANEEQTSESSQLGPSLKMLSIAGVLVLLAAFVNPYFERGAFFPAELYRKFSTDQEFYSIRIGEFQQPIEFIRQYGVSNLYLQAQIALAGLAVASFVWLGFHRRVNLMRLLLFVAFSHLAWEASRNSNLFSLVAGVIVCDNCRDVLRLKPSQAMLAGWWGNRLLAQVVVVTMAGLLLAVFSGVWGEWSGEGNSLSLATPQAYYMHDAARFAGQDGFPQTAFVASFGHASVYAYHNSPARRVFMDGRLEVCSRETFEKFELAQHRLVQGDPRFVELIRGPDGEMPVIMLDSRYARMEINALMQMHDSWRLVFADGSGAVFLDVPTADSLGLSYADPTPLVHPPRD